MSEINVPDKEPGKKRQFMREQIVKQPMTKRQIAKRFTAFLLAAVLCGTAAGASFAVVRPLSEKYLVPKPQEESIPISIPKDEPELLPSESESAPTQEVESEPIEEILQSAIESYKYSADDLNSLYSTLRSISQEANKGIVVVHSVKRDIDWFDNPVETAGIYAGAVIVSTKSELLILTPDGAVENADSIKVTFSDNVEVSGTIKQVDKISGMAIVSVDTAQMDESTLENVRALKLGNSYGVKQGDVIIAIGAPAGIVYSANYGFISHIFRNVQIADGITRLLYADVIGNAETGTFLININGDIIGLVTDQYKSEESSGMTAAMAISDYKSILEKMTNGVAVPYIGIKGQEVTEAVAEGGLPLGVYVTDCMTEGPAYNAGIQNGDIITRIGEKEIVTMKDFQSQVEAMTKDHVVTIVIQRKGIDEYKELEYPVTVGAR